MNDHTAKVLDRIHTVPPRFWIGLAAVFAAILILKIFFTIVKGTNKIVTYAIIFVAISITLANWVYNRTEPEWATPFISKLANSGFLPTKGAYEVNQSKLPDEKRAK